MLITALLALHGCGGATPPPTSSPEGKLCGRAYGSTVDSLDEHYTKSGLDLPTPIPKDQFVKNCLEAGFTEAQLKCLDVKIYSVDPECKKTMEPVVDKMRKLQQTILPQAATAAPAAGEAKDGDAKEEGGE